LNNLKAISPGSIPAPTTARTAVAWKYIIIMVISAFAGAWAGILGRLAQGEGVPTPYIIAFRQVVGLAILTPFVFTVYRDSLSHIRKRDLLFAAITGTWFAVHLLLGFGSLEFTSILVNGVMGGSTPIWIGLAEVFILHTALSRQVWVGLLTSVVGGVVIAVVSAGDSSLGSNPLLGIIMSLGSALTGAAYALMGRGARKRMRLVPFMWLIFLFASIITVGLVLFMKIPLVGYSPASYGYMLLLVLLAQLFGHLSFNYVLRHVPATITSVIGQLGIVIAAIIAFFLFHEVPGPLELVGSAIIIVGITIVNLGKSPPEAAPTT
jgi:drug/metabolite transporter (DMT)-like permease